MAEKKNTNEQIVNKILESIETTNKLPWNAGWVRGGFPVNLTTGRRYNGINILMLWSRGFNKPMFATYKQIADKGGQVKKGEKGTPIIYYNFIEKAETNEKTGDEKVKQVPFAKLSYAFNISQTEGMVEQEVTGEHKDAETFISKLPAKIIHGYDPCYAPKSDEVRVPLRSDVLETLRQRIYELQEQQICNLKEEYGIRWDQMTGTASGSGYEICQEILTTLNNIQAKDYWEFMSPCIVEEEHANLAPTIFPKISPNPSSLNSSLLNEFAEELKRNARRSNERGTTE